MMHYLENHHLSHIRLFTVTSHPHPQHTLIDQNKSFTGTITHYQKANWTSFKQHVISYRHHPTNVHKANKILSSPYCMPVDPSFLKKIKPAHIALTCPCISTSSFYTLFKFGNKTDQTHKSLS